MFSYVLSNPSKYLKSKRQASVGITHQIFYKQLILKNPLTFEAHSQMALINASGLCSYGSKHRSQLLYNTKECQATAEQRTRSLQHKLVHVYSSRVITKSEWTINQPKEHTLGLPSTPWNKKAQKVSVLKHSGATVGAEILWLTNKFLQLKRTFLQFKEKRRTWWHS